MARVNWAQAFAEIGLLVAGVLVALGGDAWMDERRDRDAEFGYLQALRVDFEETRTLILKYIADNRRSIDASVELLEVLAASPTPAATETVTRLTKDAFWVYTLEPVRATYEDLVNSGQLDLVRSTELRSALARADEDLLTIDTFDDLQWEHWMRLELEFLREHTDLAVIYPEYTGAAAQEGLEVEPIRYPESGHGPDLPAFWSRDFRNIVIARTIIFQDALVAGHMALRRTDEVLQLLDEGLQRLAR